MAFYMTFENEIGKIIFSAGSAAGDVCKTVAVTGLHAAPKEFNVISYTGEAGQMTVSEADLARVITVSGDVVARSRQLQRELSYMARVLYRPGVLKLQAGNKQRKIACRCTTMDEPVRKGPDVAGFVVQFTCDVPYFNDFTPRVAPLFERVNRLGAEFTLPLVFTARTSRMNVVNTGDVRTEPLLYINNAQTEGDEPPADGSGYDVSGKKNLGIEIENHTTGQHLWLLYRMKTGEQVAINIKDRTIISNMPAGGNNQGNLVHFISKDTFLNDFWLEPGSNDIEVHNYNTAESISVVCRYDNQYVEAVY